jgi:hypothetical protein
MKKTIDTFQEFCKLYVKYYNTQDMTEAEIEEHQHKTYIDYKKDLAVKFHLTKSYFNELLKKHGDSVLVYLKLFYQDSELKLNYRDEA